MYRKHPNGTVEIVGDLEMNIPPVGTVFNVITGEWESRPIYSRSDKANEQFGKGLNIRKTLGRGYGLKRKNGRETRKRRYPLTQALLMLN